MRRDKLNYIFMTRIYTTLSYELNILRNNQPRDYMKRYKKIFLPLLELDCLMFTFLSICIYIK